MTDLTVILIPSDWSEYSLSRTLNSVANLILRSGVKAQCLIAEFLPNGANPRLLRDQKIKALPSVVQRSLECEAFQYFVDYGSTARALRRAVRCATGRYVCLLREGDEIGVRLTADHHLVEDWDVLLAVSVMGEASLGAHQRMSTSPAGCRALPALIGIATSYEGALLASRDFLDDALGRIRYDAEPGYYGFLNEVITLALLRDSGRVQFTEQIAIFPNNGHVSVHRKRTCDYTLPTLLVRRRNDTNTHEEGTEKIVDGLLGRIAMLFSRTGLLREPAALPGRVIDFIAGKPTVGVDAMLTWLVDCIFWSWAWVPEEQHPRTIPKAAQQSAPYIAEPQVSLISSAFRGQSVIHGFFSNLLQQTIASRTELIVVTPERNFVQDLVCEYFALSTSQVRLQPLEHDPGIYECWNVAVQASRGQFLSNVNLDDRRDRLHVERLLKALEETGADVASSAVAITHDLSELLSFEGDVAKLADAAGREIWFGGGGTGVDEKRLQDFFAFDERGEVTQCMNFPHCMPMWRRSLHERYGAFDERRNGTYADFALWLRAVSRGARFVHLQEPLGLYYVDPLSHNRRNASGVTWERIVREALPADIGLRLPVHVQVKTLATVAVGPLRSDMGQPKFNFGNQISQNYGRHRSGWAYAMHGLADFHDPAALVYCNTFIEKRFVWGSDAGDGGAGPPQPHLEPWVGFIHVPPLVPSWFQFEQSNQQIFSKKAWQRSLAQCRGLFVLSEYHRRYLLETLKPSFPISVLYHPTEFPELGFDLARYLANPRKRLLQIGWWLRKLNAIDRVTAPGHTPTLLGASDWSKNLLSYAERRYHGLHAPRVADVMDFVDNDAYDVLLSENLVFLDFYDTSANNAVIECIARGTPIIVSRHPAVEDYLGTDYPLYYDDLSEVTRLASDSGRIRAARDHLQRSDLRARLTLEHFQQSFAKSEVVRYACS